MPRLLLLVTLFASTATFTNAQTIDDTEADGIYCPALSRYLKIGYRDSNTNGEVSELQQFLVDYYDLEPTQLLTTGIFGKITKGYVMNFQRDTNLTITGLVGKPTRDKIKSVCTIAQPNQTTSATTTPIRATTTNALQCPVIAVPACNGTLAPVSVFGCTFYTCTASSSVVPVSNQSCSFNNSTINHLSSLTAFLTSTVPYGNACSSETRTCTNGIFSGSYSYSSCSAAAPTCTPLASQTRTTTSCPTGQTGTITETLSSICTQGATTPTNTWAVTGNTCATVVVTPTPTPTTYTIGTKNGSYSEFNFNSIIPSLSYTFGSTDTAINNIRDWIGHSAACTACYPGTTKTQIYNFTNLSPNTETTLTIYTMYGAGDSTFTAAVENGTATISDGATKRIVSSLPTDTWTIKFTPQTANVSIKIGNGLNTGTNYFYTDQVAATTNASIATTAIPTEPSATAPGLQLTNRLITSLHRYQAGAMFGGWGSHLGHMLRDSSGQLWYADDTGNNVYVNAGLSYSLLNGTTWVSQGTNAFYGTIQQNTASIMNNTDMIFSYGIDTANNSLQECYFYTKAKYKACNTINNIAIGSNANYVGAALTPSGATKVVWWTNVVDNGSGKFNYIYNTSGAGWNGPFSTTLAGYNDIAYENVYFSSETSFDLVGQAVTGIAPSWSYHVLYGKTSLGTPLSFSPSLSTGTLTQTSNNDIFIDPAGGKHIILRGIYTGKVHYLYVNPGGVVSSPLEVGTGGYARFVVTDSRLHLVQAKNTGGITIKIVPIQQIAGPVNWASSISVDYLAEPFQGIYTESKSYQSAPVTKFNVGLNPTARQNEVIQVQEI